MRKIMIKMSRNAKKILTIYTAVFLSIAAFFTLAIAAYAKISNQIKNNNAPQMRTIILDPGHGGEDGGAVGLEGVIEKDINLAVSLKLRDLLKASGYNIIMTREKDESIYNDDCKTLRQKKNSDLNNRVDIIQKNSKENTIFVSVHQNKFPQEKYHGAQIFYSKNDPNSQDLAMSIRSSVTSLLQPDNTREIKPENGSIFLLKKSNIPAVVVECGFVSNAEEATKLKTDEYQKKLAFCVFCGICNFYSALN